ncbi:MAG: TRAP transporter small permease subunit [Pseudomonadota bacterium]
MEAFLRLVDRVVEGMAIAAGLLLAALTVLLCLDVFIRYFQAFNLPWIGDVASISLYAMTFLAAPWVLKIGGHIAVDSVVQALPESLRRGVRSTANLIGAAISAVLLFYAVRVLTASYAAGTQVYKMLTYPQWILYTLPPITFGLLLVLFLRAAFLRRTADG